MFPCRKCSWETGITSTKEKEKPSCQHWEAAQLSAMKYPRILQELLYKSAWSGNIRAWIRDHTEDYILSMAPADQGSAVYSLPHVIS